MDKRILVVDDDEDILEILKTMLGNRGYEVEEAEDGETALERLESEQFDLLVLDIVMPGMNGYEVMEKMKESGIRMPVVMLTARTDIDSFYEAHRRGSTLYLTKPFDKGYLTDMVDYLIGDLTREEMQRIEKTRFTH